MKKHIIFLLLFAINSSSFAQWNFSGTNIQNTNNGDVYVGTSAIPSTLKVYGKIYSHKSKSDSPLEGEFLGVSGWWGFRTSIDNSFHFDIYNNNLPKSVLTINQQGQLFLNARKADTPLAGELIGSSGWWGFRTSTDNSFHFDIYNNNSPKSALTINPEGQLFLNARRADTPLIGELVGSNGYWGFRTSTDNSFHLDIHNGNAPKAALSVNQTGNIGIGTTTPDSKLTVKGDIHTREVRVDMAGVLVAPDYVFDEDYNLISLTELESYLKKNKHLPEVPSAKEFEAEGMKLKEMNLTLLKKVEELTLYVIEQNNQLINQQEIIEKQNERIDKIENQANK